MPEKKETNGYQLILGYLGVIFIMAGVVLLIPLLILFAFPQDIVYWKCFLIPGIISIMIGYLLSFFIRGKERGKLHKNQDAIIVTVSWMIMIVISSIPFIMTGEYNFTQAVFECTSGYSTTGLSVVNVETTSHIFLFFRSVMLFFGGVGLVLVVMSVMSDYYGMRLYTAEGHSDRMMPNLLKSARVIIAIYSGYILGGTLLYMVFGMNWFDAINHAIGAVSTGGFSTKAQSIGYYNSVAIEIITIVLMLLGATNFFVHLLIVRRQWKKVITHCEFKLCYLVYPIAITILTFGFVYTFGMSVPKGIRAAAFQAVSAMTTTGFQTVSFSGLTPAMLLVMTLIMLIGGGVGSTAGGLKQYRVYVLMKQIFWNMRRKVEHKRVIHVDQLMKYGKLVTIDEKEQKEISSFAFLYFLVFMAGTFIFTCFGYSVQDAMFEFSSALSTVGLSMGITGYDAHPVLLWTGTIGMFIGRLEIYIVLIGIIRVFGDIKGKGKELIGKRWINKQ